MTDIVIPLGTGSPWQNNELRYTLRSIEKHLHGYRNIYIVGDKPAWLQNVIHIPFKEVSLAAWKESNICHKIMEACLHPELTGNFLFFNDDHFLLRSINAGDFPFFHCGMMSERFEEIKYTNPYARTIKNTLRLIGDGYNYDCHCPVLFNQESFLLIMNRIDWSKPFGYLMKSLYCNEMKIIGQYLPDCKINQRLEEAEIYDMIKDRPFFSVGNAGLTDVMKYVLNELYPVSSRWEIK